MGGAKKGSDPSRAERKAKKRKLEDAIPDVPGDDGGLEEPAATPRERSEKPAKKRKRDDAGAEAPADEKRAKKEKKSKKGSEEGGVAPKGDGDDAEVVAPEKKAKKSKKTAEPAVEEADKAEDASEAPKKSKKERKAERKAREAAEAAAAAAAAPTTTTGAPAPASGAAEAAAEKKAKKSRKEKKPKDGGGNASANGKTDGKPARFIVFIGSLPYTATTATVQKHFASVKPISVRAPTQKEDAGRSKGYAFLEFEGYDHMKTCLKLFHHSTFDDGVSPPRKISVELTAGGGGNTKERKMKIQSKNEKLNEERVRRIQEEAKTKAAKNEAAIDESSIHPSRRTMVPGG